MVRPKSVHFLGIGGVGMGTLAVSLARMGVEVSGSDHALYDPMKTILSDAKVRLFQGFTAGTCQQVAPRMVVIGNVATRENSEARAWLQKGIEVLSLPEAIRRLVIDDKRSIVVAGTHGKTTTASWIAFLLSELGEKPSYLIGGVPNDLPAGCAINEGGVVVCEGDEYDSAFFDKGAKFLHYQPHFLVLTGIEFDHADIYRDLAHVKASFEKLVALLPGDGLCVARFDDGVVMDVASDALCPVQTFGRELASMWRLGEVLESETGFDFEVLYKGRSVGRFQTPLYGEHNLFNLLSGIVCAVNLGASIQKIAPIVARFTGVRRRQQILKKEPVWIIDDFAHHPTEVLATLSAVRRRHKAGRVFALFEARSATARRNVHQEVYPKAFAPADVICVSGVVRSDGLDERLRFSPEKLVSDLIAMGKIAAVFETPAKIVEFVQSQMCPGDCIVVMSNGDFGGIQDRLLPSR